MAISGTYAAGDQVNFSNMEFGIDLGASGTFVAIESWTTDVQVSGGERETATTRTHGGSAIVGVSNKNSVTVVVTCVYSQDSTDPFQNIYDAYAANSDDGDCDVQWNKNGATTGDDQWTTDGGKLVHCSVPTPLAAADANIGTFTFTIECSEVDLGAHA